MTLVGEMDVAAVPEFEKHFNVAQTLKKPRIVLDMTSVSFIGSLGMGYLVSARRNAGRVGTEIVLACLKSMISEALRRAALLRAFSVFPTVDEAMAAPPRPVAPVSPPSA